MSRNGEEDEVFIWGGWTMVIRSGSYKNYSEDSNETVLRAKNRAPDLVISQ